MVIEQAVAASGSGSALMARLHNERYERGIEIRLLPAERAADLMSSEPGTCTLRSGCRSLPSPSRRGAASFRSAYEPATTSRRSSTARRSRCWMCLEWCAGAFVDRAAAAAARACRAAARTRIGEDGGDGRVSTFEIGPTPHYRAGIAFTGAIPSLTDDAPKA